MNEDIYFTIMNFTNNTKTIKVNNIIKLIKEPENEYDDEAIKIEMKRIGKIGYVANSVKTVARGTQSAGRIYDKITDKDYGQIKFITDTQIICKLLTPEEIEKERQKQNSDIHFLE